MPKPRKVVWLCDQDHLEHPFIMLGAETLAAAGCDLAVIDRGVPRAGLPYRHLGVGLHRGKWRVGKLEIWGTGRLKKWIGWPLMFLRLMRERPSVVIVDLPTTGRLGLLARKFLPFRLVYYPFELFGEQVQKSPPAWKRLERRILSGAADAVITQNEARARVYREERGSRVEPAIVHNYKRAHPCAPAGKLQALLGVPPGSRIVLYEGHLVPGRWLEHLVAAAPHLPAGSFLAFLGKPTPWWDRAIGPLLKDPATGSRVRMGGWVPHHELLGYVADADAGIIIYDDSVRNNVFCEPGKLSDYVLAGVPVLAPAFPTIAPVVESHRIGAVFAKPDPREIAAAAARLLEVPKAEWRPRMESAAKHLVWETQAPVFLRAVLGG